jgi:predicted ATP-grasp superfamily ATP-dependent carboligase
MKISRYPLHYASVGVLRTLGRAGVPVFAVTEDRYTPTARSRYLREAFVWPTTGLEDPDELVAGVVSLGDQIGARTVLIPTDDEAALLVAEHADVLRRHFLLPDVAPDVPRRLASKRGLAELCKSVGIPTPACVRPRSVGELSDTVNAIGFPVVIKNDGAWERIAHRAVPGTTVVRDDGELARLVSSWPSMPGLVVQEYLPHRATEDWSVYLYCGSKRDCVLAFTGRKLRSFPPYTGVTAVGLTAPNEELRERAVAFCRAVGYRGIASMDWRLDRRDGAYKLLDFNVRVGGRFRTFETERGVDVVRALHLDLTGREVPLGREVPARRFVVGNLALAAALMYRRDGAAPLRLPRRPPGGVERAWFAYDDPIPGVLATIRVVALAGQLMRPEVRHRGWAWLTRGGGVPRGRPITERTERATASRRHPKPGGRP